MPQPDLGCDEALAPMHLHHSFPRFRSTRAVALWLASAAAACASDFSWRNVQVGGFASQGYVKSSANDYIGDSSDGTFDFREYAANASWSMGKWRIGAQAFAQKLGVYGRDKIKLDWAMVDYQAAQWLGVRVGRVKTPRGLYNEALDVDAVRPFVLLPQSVYDARLRDFNASFDGAMTYGNIGCGKFGSIDYKAFYGDIAVSSDSGANDYFNGDKIMPNYEIGMDSVIGGSLFWNTPLQGLRVGYSFNRFKNLSTLRSTTGTAFDLHTKTAAKFPRTIYSAEYVVANWTFASEFSRESGDYVVNYINRVRTSYPKAKITSYYGSASRRINRWLEVGGYYDSYEEINTLSTGVQPPKKQIDRAVSLRFDVSEHLIFKIEGHSLRGPGKILDTAANPQPYASLTQKWSMLAAKVTYTF
jgi:hypothetical protein